MAVTKTDKVAGHGVDSCRARVCQPPLKPGSRLPEILQEEVVQAGCIPGAYLHISQSSVKEKLSCRACIWRTNCGVATTLVRKKGHSQGIGSLKHLDPTPGDIALL